MANAPVSERINPPGFVDRKNSPKLYTNGLVAAMAKETAISPKKRHEY